MDIIWLSPVLLVVGFVIAMLIFKSKWKKLGEDFGRYAVAYRNALLAGEPVAKQVQLPDALRSGEAEMIKLAEKVQEVIKHPKSAPDAPDAREELQKSLNNTLIINELGQQITASLHLVETVSQLYTTLNSMMDASIVELAVHDQRKGQCHYYINRQGKAPDSFINHMTEWMIANNRNIRLEDAEAHYGRYVDKPLVWLDGRAAGSIMGYPVLQNELVVGAISVISFRKNAFDDYHEESLRQLLGFIAIAVQNAHTHEQINQLRIRAEESEKYEQQFLANMSHEIRTPMNAVLGMTHLLLDTELNERQRRYLSAISISSKNLLVIINDILDLSKLEAGKMEIEKIPFRIRDVVGNVVDTSRFKAEEKGLIFEINISPDLPEVVKGDPTRLNQILTNLCSNAIKFTERGRVTISVDAAANSQFIQFRVIDTGIGIPADKLHLLFGNFKQVDSSTFRKYGGTGLGLSISKTLIELQGGKVTVKSELGKGSEFAVQIPYEIGSEADVSAMHNEQAIDYGSLSHIRILIAEDNEYNQIVVNDTLETLIHDVHIDIAENGLIALEKHKAHTYDVILMDAQMPEMDGLEATRRIRALSDPKKNSIPILALTASVHKADIDKCIHSGMNDFIPKPFTREELLGTIQKHYHHEPGWSLSDGSRALTKEAEMQTAHDTPPAAAVKKEEPTPIPSPAAPTPQPSKSAVTTETISQPKVTDMGFLEEFTEGNRERMLKYIGLYLKLLPDNQTKIQAAIDADDYEGLVKVIHAMRPHLNYMGMKEAGDLAATIENNIREQQALDEVSAMARTVLDHCKISQTELHSFIKV